MDFHLRQLPPRCWKRNRKHHKFRNHAPISMVYKKELSSEFSLESGTHKREKGRCTSFRGLLGSAQVVASSSYSGIVLLARQNSLSRGVCAAAHRHICALPERRCILAIREPLEHPHLPALEIYGRPWRF